MDGGDDLPALRAVGGGDELPDLRGDIPTAGSDELRDLRGDMPTAGGDELPARVGGGDDELLDLRGDIPTAGDELSILRDEPTGAGGGALPLSRGDLSGGGVELPALRDAPTRTRAFLLGPPDIGAERTKWGPTPFSRQLTIRGRLGHERRAHKIRPRFRATDESANTCLTRLRL